MKSLKNKIINSNFTNVEIEMKQNVIYFMNAIAIAKYIIEYDSQRDVLSTLNKMRDKKDVNEIAVDEAKKLQIIR